MITPLGRVARLSDIHFLGICGGGLLDKFCWGYKLLCSACDVAVFGDFFLRFAERAVQPRQTALNRKQSPFSFSIDLLIHYLSGDRHADYLGNAQLI